MLRILSLVLLISATSSHQVPFKSCAKHPSDDRTRLDIKTIDINPWPVKDGNDGSANFTIDLRKHLDQGSRYDLEIRYGRYLIVHQKGDLCKLDPSLTCPKEPNDNVQMLYHFKMPQLPVFGKLNLRIQIWDQDSLELCCVSFDIEVEPQRGSSGSLSDLLQSIFRRREDGKAKTNQNN